MIKSSKVCEYMELCWIHILLSMACMQQFTGETSQCSDTRTHCHNCVINGIKMIRAVLALTQHWLIQLSNIAVATILKSLLEHPGPSAVCFCSLQVFWSHMQTQTGTDFFQIHQGLLSSVCATKLDCWLQFPNGNVWLKEEGFFILYLLLTAPFSDVIDWSSRWSFLASACEWESEWCAPRSLTARKGKEWSGSSEESTTGMEITKEGFGMNVEVKSGTARWLTVCCGQRSRLRVSDAGGKKSYGGALLQSVGNFTACHISVLFVTQHRLQQFNICIISSPRRPSLHDSVLLSQITDLSLMWSQAGVDVES